MKKNLSISFYLIGIIIILLITSKYLLGVNLFQAGTERFFCLAKNLIHENTIKLEYFEIKLPMLHWFILKEEKDLYVLQGHYKEQDNEKVLLVSVIKEPEQTTLQSILDRTCVNGNLDDDNAMNMNFHSAICRKTINDTIKPYKILNIPSKKLLIWIEDYQEDVEDEKEYKLLLNNIKLYN